MTYRAFLDANVLVPARVRDVILTLAEAETYEPLWSSDVLDEVTRNLPSGVTAEGADHLRRVMTDAFPESGVIVPDGVSIDVETVNAHDRHVALAALWSGADVLVTADRSLTHEMSARIDVQAPGLFVAYAIDTDPERAMHVLISMAQARWPEAGAATSDEEVLRRLRDWMHRCDWPIAANLIDKDQP